MLLVLSIQFTQMIHLIDSVWILPWSLIINVLINFLLAQVRMSYESFINIQLKTHNISQVILVSKDGIDGWQSSKILPIQCKFYLLHHILQTTIHNWEIFLEMKNWMKLDICDILTMSMLMDSVTNVDSSTCNMCLIVWLYMFQGI